MTSISFLKLTKFNETQAPAQEVVPVLSPIKPLPRTLLVFLYTTYLVVFPLIIVAIWLGVLTIFLNF